ncbi:MAG: hypothetical protein BGN96_08325 [Bacteroidales bacterium 45-6]|nr:MAG: hypothetical protein BGN96_08325 [Bacteroidales bacterium 45-6]
MNKGLLLVFLFLEIGLICAQNKPKDEEKLLLELAQNTTADSMRVNILLKLTNANYGVNPKMMAAYCDQAIDISQKVGYKKGQADAFRFRGIAYYTTGDFLRAESYFLKALEANEGIRNNTGIIACLSNLGSVNMVQNNYPKALKYYQQGLRKSNEAGDNLNSGIIYGNMGVIYNELGDYAKAFEHFEGGISQHKKIGYKAGIANGLGNIGNVYFKQKRYKEAQTYYHQALDADLELGNKLAVARDYGNLGNSYFELRDQVAAYENYQKALDINLQIKNKKGEAVIRQGLANYYLGAGNLNLALEQADAAIALATEANVADVKVEAYKTLSETYEKKQDYAHAYESFKKYVELKNLVDNDNSRKQILRLEAQYEFDTKEQEYQNAQLLATAQLSQQALQLKNNSLLLSESNKQKEIERLRYLKTQSELEKEQLLSEDSKRKLKLTEQERNFQKSQNVTLQKEKQLRELQLKNFWLYALVSLLVLAGLASLYIYRLTIRSLKSKNELARQNALQVEKELLLKNEIKEAEMQSLRSQMNPHFMFNAINSINNFILKNQKETASQHLTTFAKLMRSILENSKHALITLEKELDTLKCYMQLETARLDNSFQYNIRLQDSIDDSDIKIPPLVLQPFVENAIWHGLRTKQSGGLIRIEVTSVDEEWLIISILDNGIGREASAKLQNRGEHKSYGIETTVNRILLQNPENGVEIIDLYDEGRKATGTEVKIRFKL